jgi:heme/copper-type cytochrome/quinol oxidase subunit 2
MKQLGLFAIFGAAVVLAAAPSALGCAACFGQSDSAMARSVNASIFTLMGVIGTVLFGAASFFVFLARRAATHAQEESTTHSSSQPQS